MSQEVVEVIETQSGGVWVEAMQRSACNSCSARSGCGSHSLSKLGKQMRIWVPTRQILQPGQQVVIVMPEGGLAQSALTLYGVPLLSMLLFALLASALGSGEGPIALASLFGLLPGFLTARLLAQRFQSRWQPSLYNDIKASDAACGYYP